MVILCSHCGYVGLHVCVIVYNGVEDTGRFIDTSWSTRTGRNTFSRKDKANFRRELLV